MRSGLEVEETGEGLEWTDGGLEVDSMDEMGTGGGLHEDPWGSVRYSTFPMTQHSHKNGAYAKTTLH